MSTNLHSSSHVMPPPRPNVYSMEESSSVSNIYESSPIVVYDNVFS